ncbi:MAG: cysteine desulfurase family protein [Thermoguttaceae bacterium]|jgi:cysteine desulfurase
MNTIYLDHNATTPIRPEVVEAMVRCYAQGYANPASQHQPGQRAHRVLEDARERIAAILGADLTCPQADRLIFTAGGTEANNLAVLGIARARGARRTDSKSVPRDSKTIPPQQQVEETHQIIISAVEHQSVIEPAEHLLDQGWRLDTLSVTPDGVVRPENLPPLLGEQTRLVSVIWGNHETGVIQPIAQLAQICNRAGVFFHTDAVQTVGKIPVDFRSTGAAAMSLAAHKFHGPLGIGALILRHDVPIAPIQFGGHHQFGIRPGTESAALAVGMLTALELWQNQQDSHRKNMESLRRRFEDGLKAAIPEIIIHGASADRLPQTSNIAFPGLDAQVLLLALDVAGVACSVGSACSSGSTELSPTLRAMGLPNEIVAGSLRFSLGWTTTQAEIDEALSRIISVCSEIRNPT